jgi:predicted permease
VGVDGRVFAFALGLSLASGLLFGLVPALRATRRDLVASLRNESAGALGRRGLREALVVGQVAVSLVLLVVAGLLVKSLAASLATDPGFDPRRLAMATVDLSMVRYPPEEGKAFYRQLLEGVRALPEVESAALADRLPFSLNVHGNHVYLEGRPVAPDDPGFAVDTTRVGPGFLATLGVPLVAGRDFGLEDGPGSPGVVLVNQALARRFWPGEDPLGQRLRLFGADGPSFEVVGVAADHKVRTMGEAPRPFLMFAREQRYSPSSSLLVRSRGSARALAAALRREILALEPELVLVENQTMEEMIGATLLPARLGSLVLGAFGALALVLAAVGLYGVVAYSVARRSREIGVRMAVGAEPGSVVAMVLGQGMLLVAIGLGIGLAAAAGATQLLGRMLYGIGRLEPGTYLGASALLAAVALLANLLPARRAARLDPVLVLKQE